LYKKEVLTSINPSVESQERRNSLLREFAARGKVGPHFPHNQKKGGGRGNAKKKKGKASKQNIGTWRPGIDGGVLKPIRLDEGEERKGAKTSKKTVLGTGKSRTVTS